jgi:hypothetical protein
MRDGEIGYKNVVLIPMAAYDGGTYAAMLIVRELDGLQRASGILGHFACALDARKFALAYGMTEIDARWQVRSEPAKVDEWNAHAQPAFERAALAG